MKLLCPRCGAGNRIGWQTRYQSFSCSSCNLIFFGLEATTSLGSFFLDDPSKTPCPFCWRYIRLMPDANGGWYGPEAALRVCKSCPGSRNTPGSSGRPRQRRWSDNFRKANDDLRGTTDAH